MLQKTYYAKWCPDAPLKQNTSNAARLSKELYKRIFEAFENCPKKLMEEVNHMQIKLLHLFVC